MTRTLTPFASLCTRLRSYAGVLSCVLSRIVMLPRLSPFLLILFLFSFLLVHVFLFSLDVFHLLLLEVYVRCATVVMCIVLRCVFFASTLEFVVHSVTTDWIVLR